MTLLVLSGACASKPAVVVRTKPKDPTRVETIAAINAACRNFLAGDAKLNQGATTLDAQHQFASGRLALVRQAEGELRTAPFAPSLRPMRKQVALVLGELDALYSRAQTETNVQPLLEQSEDLLGQVVGTFYLAGASECVPNVPSVTAAPPPPDAGPLLPLKPIAVITVGPIGADDNRIVADDTAVWVGLKNLNEIVRIDPRTNAVVATIPLGEAPSGAPQIIDGYLWISTNDYVIRIDPATNQIDRRINRVALGFGNAPIAVTSTALFGCENGTLLTLDPSGAVRSRAFLTTGCDRLAVDHGRVWIIDDRSDMLRVDPRTGAPLTAPIPAYSSFAPLLFGGGSVWNFGSGHVERVDPDSGKLLGAGTRSDMDFIEGCYGSGGLWVASEREQRAIRFDAATMGVTELQGGRGANAIGCSTGTVWVANSDESTVMRFDVSHLG